MFVDIFVDINIVGWFTVYIETRKGFICVTSVVDVIITRTVWIFNLSSELLFLWGLLKYFVMDTIGVRKNCRLMLDFDWTLFCISGLTLRLNLLLSLFVFYFKQSDDSIFLNSCKRGSPFAPRGSFLVGPGICRFCKVALFSYIFTESMIA